MDRHALDLALAHGGAVEWLAPAVLVLAIGFALRRSTRAAVALLGAFAVAVLATAATKVAFLGWGIGSATLDFTGASGHAMCAAALYPVLGAAAAPPSSRTRAWCIALGVGLALAVGWARIPSGAHSLSEVIVGWALGFAVGGAVLASSRVPAAAGSAAFAALLLVAPMLWPGGGRHVPDAHSLVVRVSLALSGRDAAYTREWLHRSARQANVAMSREQEAGAPLAKRVAARVAPEMFSTARDKGVYHPRRDGHYAQQRAHPVARVRMRADALLGPSTGSSSSALGRLEELLAASDRRSGRNSAAIRDTLEAVRSSLDVLARHSDAGIVERAFSITRASPSAMHEMTVGAPPGADGRA